MEALPWLNNFTAKNKGKIMACLSEKIFAPGEVIMRENTYSKEAMVIMEGEIRVTS